MANYTGNVNHKLGVKYPSIHKKCNNAINYCADVWRETFPK